MAFTPAPPTPDRADKLTFPARMYNWFVWFVATIAELSTLGNAYNYATSTTSTTSNNLTVGAKTFTVPAGLGFQKSMSLRVGNSASPLNSAAATVTDYVGTTLSVNFDSINGSGTAITTWTISLAAVSVGASLAANIFTGLQRWFAGANIASAATIDLTAAIGNTVDVTGTTPTTAITITAGQQMMLIAQAAWPLTHHATNLNLPGGVNYTCAAGDRILVIKDLAGVVYVSIWKADGTAVVAPTVSILRNHLAGLTLSTAGASSTMTIAAGQATDSANVVTFTLAAALNKTTSAWAVGSGNGGLDTGTILSSAIGATCSFATTVMTCTVAPTSGNFAVGQLISGNGLPSGTFITSLGTGTGGTGTYNLGTTPGTLAAQTTQGYSWYHFYAIRRPDTGVVDVVLSANATTPTLPANYTQYRRIGSGLMNGSGQWFKFKQLGDWFEWDIPFVDFNSTGSTTAALLGLTVPYGVEVNARVVFFSQTSNHFRFSNPNITDTAPSNSVGAVGLALGITVAGASIVHNETCWTNTSAQIRHRSQSTATASINTHGYYDPRGENN